MKNNNGFTIIELLVSVAILSIVLTGISIILVQQQRQFNLTSQGVDVNQTGRAALNFIATEIRNTGARQGKNVAFAFVNGGSEFSPLCSDTTTKTGQVSPPDCLTLFTWDISEGFEDDEIKSTAIGVDVTLVTSELSINVGKWLTPLADSNLIESGGLIGFWSRGTLCNEVNASSCLGNPEDCTECGAILKVDSLNAATKVATVSNTSSILAQNFQLSDFSDISDFYNSFFLPKISALSSEMTIVQAKTFTIRDDNALVMDENGAGNFQPIAGGEVDYEDTAGDGDQIGAGIVDLQFVFNLQDSDGGITRVGMPFDDDEAVRQFADFTTVSSMSLPYNGDMRGREKDTRTVEIYLVVRSRLKPQLISGNRIPSQDLAALGDVAARTTSHSSLGEGFIYRVFNTVVYLRNLGREEFG
jgi:prepilin-type N-terminal cleavage/methylation domain-containing protein